jgi:diguanylate cyclase (GGDEF)-like protein
MPVEALNRQRRSTMRFGAVIERISEGLPIDAGLIERMRLELDTLKAANAELAQVTQRQNNELAALKSAIRSTSDAIIACDLKGRITAFNKGAEEIFQLEASDQGVEYDPETSNGIDENIFHLCEVSLYRGEAGSTPDAGLMERLRANGTVQNLRIVFKGNRGRISHTLFSLDYNRDASGKATGLIANIKDNSEVERLTQVDPDTELYNKRYFDAKILEVCGLINRGLYPCASAVFLDIDHFGLFNKKYSQDVGDQVLKAVAATMRRVSRDTDTVVRLGGEEFLIILPSTDEATARVFAERLCKAIAETAVVTAKHGTLSVTASIGIATHHQGSGSAQDFIDRADGAMRAAKQNGRNQVRASAA